ncbi:hypothetical protein [Nocardia sp. NPDC051832]|uniref:hypothetical protein n=1 Tax=Nocardia sp. NPDC051832 TaxID=3155673 RepID=UPI003436CA9F
MGEFVATTLSFPTALFTFALIVVFGYWLLVLAGYAQSDQFDHWNDAESDGITIRFEALGLGGVPVTVALTGVIALAWFCTLGGATALAASGIGGYAEFFLTVLTPAAALVAAVAGTRVLVLPLRRLFRTAAAPSHTDFVGRICVIRTGRVDSEFGQAELVSADGSSAIIQVRQSTEHAVTTPLTQGNSAVVYDYDQATETFWVASLEGI